MSIDRTYRRDGETEYPELAPEDAKFELEVAILTEDRDRYDIAMMQAIRYVPPIAVARLGTWEDEAGMLRDVYGPMSDSNKYGERI